MKYTAHTIAILLAATVATLSFCLVFQNYAPETEGITEVPSENEVYTNILTRNSVRSYTDEPITDDLIEKLLRAGMAAPTAGNGQPWEFYVIHDTAIIKQMNTVTKYAAPMNERAPLAIVVCGVPSEAFPVEPRYWVQDVSAATENILLSAHALGLGAVWCGVYPGEDRVETLRKLIDAPDHLIPFNIIMIGHPDSETPVKDKWKPSKVHHIRP